jgi:signal transduction histidine kinase
MVDERTKDLSLEAMERRSDVLLFVSLLDALKTSQTRRELIETALPSIGTRYGAARAAFICTVSAQNFFSWPEKGRRPDLPADWGRVLAEARPVFTHDTALIPVQPSDSALEGYLCLYWDAEADTEPGQMRDVLIALGRQMGIAMENLNALDTLLRQNIMLESIFEGIADPLLLMDGSCTVIMGNEAARQLAIHADDPLGDAAPPQEDTPLPRLLGLDPAAGARCPLRQVLRQGRPTSYEATLSGQRSFALNIYPLPGSQDRGGRVVVYARENTAEKRMLESIQQSEKLVTVGKLAAGLAHEINNPLGIILCYAELLRAAADSDQQRADVDIIIRHTKRAQRVMQDLLNFARPRGGGHGPCDPVSVVAVLADVFSLQAQKIGAVLDIALPPDLPPVTTSAEALEQIMGNLLLNALDAVSQDPAAPGRITVGASHDPEAGTVTITTADNGPGIPPEHLRRIFDPFFTTKEVGKGTGLGLAVAYGLVQQAGGTIEAANDGGAVFTLTLPAAPSEAGDAP